MAQKQYYMNLTDNELAAITKYAHAMANVDGKVENSELAYMALEMARCGIKDPIPIFNLANSMTSEKALSIIRELNPEGKKYASAYMGAMMAADGKIKDKELALWKVFIQMCNLPSMSIIEALDYVSTMK